MGASRKHDVITARCRVTTTSSQEAAGARGAMCLVRTGITGARLGGLIGAVKGCCGSVTTGRQRLDQCIGKPIDGLYSTPPGVAMYLQSPFDAASIGVVRDSACWPRLRHMFHVQILPRTGGLTFLASTWWMCSVVTCDVLQVVEKDKHRRN